MPRGLTGGVFSVRMKASGKGFEGGRLHSACFCFPMHRAWLGSIRPDVPLRLELKQIGRGMCASILRLLSRRPRGNAIGEC